MSAIWTRHRVTRRMSRLPHWDSTGMRPGMLVQAAGRVCNRSTTIAPFTGRECALYQVHLREWDDGTHAKFMTIVSRTPFYLSTVRARLLLDPAHSEVHIKGQAKNGNALDDPAQLTALFDKHGLAVPEWEGGSRRSFLWRESIILSGDQVQVSGTLGSSMDISGHSTYRELPSILSIGGPQTVLVQS